MYEDTVVATEVQETHKRTKVIKLSHHSLHVIGKPVYGLPYGSVSGTLRNIAYINRRHTGNKQYSVRFDKSYRFITTLDAEFTSENLIPIRVRL